MATIKYYNYLKFIIIAAIICMAAAIASFVPNSMAVNLQSQENEYKKKDALEDYIIYLFELLDDQTNSYLFKGDSIEQTIWRQPKNSSEKLVYYNLLLNFGYHFLQQGYVSNSINWYEKALNYYRLHQSDDKILAKDMYYQEYISKPLANNYTRIGDFSKAVVVLNDALTSSFQNKDSAILSSLYLNLATTYFWMQQYDSVQLLANNGLQQIRDNRTIKTALSNIKTEAFIATSHLDSARFWNQEAFKNSSKNNSSWAATTYVNAAKINIALKQYNNAISILKKVLQSKFELSGRESAKINVMLGDLYLQNQSWKNALSEYQNALHFFTIGENYLYPDFTVVNAYYGIANALGGQQDAAAGEWYEKAIVNGYYTQMLLSSSMNAVSSIYEDEQNTKKGLLWIYQNAKNNKKDNAIKKLLWLVELNKSRKLLIEQKRSKVWQTDSIYDKNETLFNQLKDEYVLLAQATSAEQKNILKSRIAQQEYDLQLKEKNYNQQIQVPAFQNFVHWLDSATAFNTVISYIHFDSLYAGIAINKKGLELYDIKEDSERVNINQFVQSYFNIYNNNFINNPQQYYNNANTILQSFMPGYKNYDSTIFISADYMLHKIPFEALTLNNQAADFLCMHNAILYTPTLIGNMMYMPKSKKTSLAVYGFDKPHLGFPAIPNAKTEQQFLKKNFGAYAFEADETQKQSFYTQLERPEIIHLATHAVAADSSDQPFIVLKDKLYLGEIQYSMVKCPLIVLAACESGAGKLANNEGLLSLGRAFISKGVSGVVATRWEVDDAIAPKIMNEFYLQLQKTKDPVKALQQAQRHYLQTETNIAAFNPILWAGYYYQGVLQPLEIESKNAFQWLWWLLLLPLILFVKFFNKKR